MDANTLRRLNWLWKHRHTHTGDELDDVTNRLIIVEQQADKSAGTSTGAYVHLANTSGQEISDGGEAVSFTSVVTDPLNFSVTTPTDEVPIQVPGYYDAQVSLEWGSYTGGGGVWVTRTRGGDTEAVWPLVDEQWVASNGRRFFDNMPALACEPGDVLRLWVDPGAGSAQDLSRAVFVVRLLDRIGGSPAPSSSDPGDAEDLVVESHALSIGNTSSYAVPLPESADGDLLVMLVSGGDSGTAISGWSKLDSDSETMGGVPRWVTVLWKEADGSEGTSATLTFSGNAGYAMAAIRFREPGVDWSSNPPTVDWVWTTDAEMDVPTASPDHGDGNYWVIPFALTSQHGAFVSGPDGYPQIAYATHPHAWERIWVGAAFQNVTGSVTPDDIVFAGGGGGFAGVLLVKGS